jgi:hypothetical protein
VRISQRESCVIKVVLRLGRSETARNEINQRLRLDRRADDVRSAVNPSRRSKGPPSADFIAINGQMRRWGLVE